MINKRILLNRNEILTKQGFIENRVFIIENGEFGIQKEYSPDNIENETKNRKGEKNLKAKSCQKSLILRVCSRFSFICEGIIFEPDLINTFSVICLSKTGSVYSIPVFIMKNCPNAVLQSIQKNMTDKTTHSLTSFRKSLTALMNLQKEKEYRQDFNPTTTFRKNLKNHESLINFENIKKNRLFQENGKAATNRDFCVRSIANLHRSNCPTYLARKSFADVQKSKKKLEQAKLFFLSTKIKNRVFVQNSDCLLRKTPIAMEISNNF